MGRRFSVAYKERILAELDAAVVPGERGAILRREGLYWSTVSRWRQRRDAAVREGLSEGKRGPKVDRLARENRELRARNEQLEARLRTADWANSHAQALARLRLDRRQCPEAQPRPRRARGCAGRTRVG